MYIQVYYHKFFKVSRQIYLHFLILYDILKTVRQYKLFSYFLTIRLRCTMNGEERRKSILSKLKQATAPISASVLASEYSVTRQIIVADIALLRAAGHSISAKNRGYILETATGGLIKRIAVNHGKDNVTEELYAVVDNGGKVLDVIIEHVVYGKISVELNISSRYDADVFVSKITETGASPLSLLTEGLHIHTLSVPDEAAILRIEKKLSELGVLIELA